MITNKTINYAIYDRSEGKPTKVADTTSVKLPDFEYLTETVKGAGIMGEIDMPSPAQLGSMVTEIAIKNTNKSTVKLFAPKTQDIEVRWVKDALDPKSGALVSVPMKALIRGIPKNTSLGTVETNATNDGNLSLETTYIKLIEDGDTLYEVDKLNSVFIINGVDYMKAIREAL